MYRWEREVGWNGKEQYRRPEKKGLKELKSELAYLEGKRTMSEKRNSDYIANLEKEIQELKKSAKTKQDREIIAFQMQLLQNSKKNYTLSRQYLDKQIRSLKEQIRLFEENKNPSHKGFKHKTKKRSNEWIHNEVLKYIQKENPNYIMKEDIARILKVKESQVEQVFHQLNLEGILNQPVHHAPHDSQRDPWGFIGNMAWMGDLYYIRHKEEEVAE